MNETTIPNIQNRLTELIYEHFPLAKTLNVGTEQNLLDSGAVDSLGLLIIIDIVEREFVLKVEDADVTEDNFSSIVTLSQYINAKKQPQV